MKGDRSQRDLCEVQAKVYHEMFCKLNKINGRAGHTRSQLINKTLMSAKNDIKITQNISAFQNNKT